MQLPEIKMSDLNDPNALVETWSEICVNELYSLQV